MPGNKSQSPREDESLRRATHRKEEVKRRRTYRPDRCFDLYTCRAFAITGSSLFGLGTLIERFLSTTVNLSPNPIINDDGTVKLPGLDNHAMGTIFEDLLRRFNEDNNEEAGEHWTPRDAVELMAKLVFLPIEDQIKASTYVLYDGALGTGGMLTVAEQTLQEIAEKHGERISTHLYGQENNSGLLPSWSVLECSGVRVRL